MFSPEVGQSAVRITVFLVLVSGALLCFQQPGTAEFVVTVTTFAISSAFLLLVVALIKWSQR